MARSQSDSDVTMIGQTPATRELLRRLDLDVRMKLDGLLHGDYRGLVPGHGSELGETREYEPGDDVRQIDWNVTARLQETHVRETIADRELETSIVVDLSPSIDFGTAQREKRDLVLSAVGAIGMLTARVGNRVGALVMSPDRSAYIPPAQGRQHLMAILHRVADAPRVGGLLRARASDQSRADLPVPRLHQMARASRVG